jgi:hypothetical protein
MKLTNGELQVTGNDTGFLVITSGVTSQFENLGSEILKNSSEVDRSTGTDALGVVALSQKTVDTTDRESEPGLGRATEETSITGHYRRPELITNL